jgi:hypothetical protein
MIEGVAARARRLNGDVQVIFQTRLPDKLAQAAGTQRKLALVLLLTPGVDQSLLFPHAKHPSLYDRRLRRGKPIRQPIIPDKSTVFNGRMRSVVRYPSSGNRCRSDSGDSCSPYSLI